ncbi:unnamed protein product [Dibothriocephalus latus]|uniref:Uncharacterized protein n=1 Tax=Dibothriocephalus latus TaxID=60516 RepID=A0A3P6QCD1_DIBLA|nr:unnamed protein product [Dibothriocephalus latus]
MDGKPFMKTVVLKVLIRKPERPNSASRATEQRLRGYHLVLVGAHNLQEHNISLVRWGQCQDLIGVKHRLFRGKSDCPRCISPHD